MTSDETRRGQDTKWRQVGAGMPITLRCVYCDLPKLRAGGKFRGPLRKLFSCAACEEVREQKRASAA